LALARKRQRSWGDEQETEGSSIDNFLKGEGIFEEAQAQAVKEVVAWQLAKAMRTKKISKACMTTLPQDKPHSG